MASFALSLRVALLTLVQHQRRALFLGGAIAAVTALLVVLNSLTAGIRSTLEETATTLSTGHLNVGGFFKVTAGQAAPVVTDYEAVKAIVQEALPEMAFSVDRGRGWGKIVSDTAAQQASIGGVDIAREGSFQSVLRINSGSLDGLREDNTILLFEAQARKLGVKVGDAITISAQTSRGVANTLDCRVVAIAENVGLLSQWSVFVPISALRRLYQLRSDVTGVIQLHVRPEYRRDLASLAARLRNALEAAGHRTLQPDARPFWMKFESVAREDWTGQKLDVTTWEDELSFMMWTLQASNGLSFVLMVILIAIVVTGIMNTMWIAIRERTREIGTLRAIGMQRGGVLRLLLLESLALGAGGALLGVLLGVGAVAILNGLSIHVPTGARMFLMSDTVPFAVRPELLVKALFGIAFVTAAASLLPALRAARLRPIDAMSHFG
jgi:ABC-type lipoprotein release transport system permease subunit